MILNKGFYPALGTPLNKNGELAEESYRKQIEAMISSGTSGALCMGSMGTQAALSSDTYLQTAKTASEAVNGRVPLFIGAMDNSVSRVSERMDALKNMNFDGIVLTTPFYGTTTEKNLIRFFKAVADIAPRNVYLYDLPAVTKQKITYDMVCTLANHPNIVGIKTGDIVLARKLHLTMPDFHVLFSNLDAFDVAESFGLPMVLDGMFTCTPSNAEKFQKCYLKHDTEGVGKYLNNILGLRDIFLNDNIWPSYTCAMNLLGFCGNYGFGYEPESSPAQAQAVKDYMTKIGELK